MDEIQTYYPEKVRMKTEEIDHRLLQIFAGVKGKDLLPPETANRYTESRIHEIHKLRHFYVPD